MSYGRSIKKQVRILVVSQYFWPENFRINDLVKEWIRRGHEVTVLTGVPNYPGGKVFEAYRMHPHEFDEFEGAKVIRVPMIPRGAGSLRLFLNYLSFCLIACIVGPWRLRGKAADVIFVYEPSPVTVGLPAVLLGRMKKTPVVFWALDLWPETLAAVGIIRSQRILNSIGHMVRFIYNRCTLVLGQSKSFISSIAQYCDDVSKIRYFPSWSEEMYGFGSCLPAPEVPEQIDAFTILFAGNIGEAQDMPAVLDAADVLRDNPRIRWLIVGDGRKSDWMRAEVVRRGLERQVLMPGRFPLERMPSFFLHADALLVSLKPDPVFSMTIPGKVQSYMMAGIPLLGMLDGEGAEVIRDAQAGLTCKAGDASGLARAALSLASMSIEERKRMGSSGQNYCQKEFGRTQLLNRLDDFLIEAVMIYKKDLKAKSD